ncbi:MAG: 2,3-bisphosphoglycerate-dependent phosphoglycerate mutase [Parcubacteria bacterium C7867-003]|nr:MAG: 2,3-bisphosphoglycerate-dependent phosphoglycerate mutase [Parcubacteria bacterium C7867-003]
MAKLFLVRHGLSEWNKLGLWTGWTDVDLAEEGMEEARESGLLLKDEIIDKVYTSELKRTHQTFEKIKEGSGKHHLTNIVHKALSERHYGIHTGKNKWQVKEEIGEEEFQNIRRGWDIKIEGGETLKDVHARVAPYYEENIKKDLLENKNVLVVAHGNTLRALIKHLENLEESQVSSVEVATDEIHIYELDSQGKYISKEIKKGKIK